MSKLERVGKIKLETEVVDLAYRRLKVNDKKVVMVEFELKRAIDPQEANDIASLIAEFVKSFVKPDEDELLGISGRGPIYLYMLIQHKLAHIVTYMGQYDPKINAIVVTSAHAYTTKWKEGDIVKLPDELKEELAQT